MPAPSTSLATLRPELAGSLEEFDLLADRQGFIAPRVLPVFEVQKAAGTFGKIAIESLLANVETRRAPRTGYSRGDWKFTTDSYATEEHGHEEVVDDNEAAMYREYFEAELISAARALDVVLRNAERRVADAIFNATTWASYKTEVTTEWSTAASATPIDDVEAAVQAIYARTGLWPDTLILNRIVFRNLRNCDQIIERIASSGAGSPTKPTDITTAMLSQVFDLPNIVVSGGTKNTATEGQSASLSPIWSSEYAMICRICSTNDIAEPGLGRTFHWSEDGSTIGGTIESYRDETVRGDVIRARHQVDEKVLYAEAGQLLYNITA
jgi:hypothetical protein